MIINLLDTLPNINYNNHKVYQCHLQSPQKRNSSRKEEELVLEDNYYFRFSEGDTERNISHLKDSLKNISFNAYTCFPFYNEDSGLKYIEGLLKKVDNNFVLVFIDNSKENQRELFGEIFKDKVIYCRPGCIHSYTFPFHIIYTILKDGGKYDYPFFGREHVFTTSQIQENIIELNELLNNMKNIVEKEKYLRICIGSKMISSNNTQKIAKSFISIIDKFLDRYTYFKNYIKFDYKNSTDVNKLFLFTNELFYCFYLLSKYKLRPIWDDKGNISFIKDSDITIYIQKIQDLQRKMNVNSAQIVTSSV